LLSYQFGPEQHIIVVEKSSHSLLVYSNYQAEPIERFTITTGKVSGQKFEEGDMKTPEGLYFFRRILSGQELPKVDDYGEKAFTLNYPNPIDRKENRNGSGIWLHGAYNAEKTSSPNNSRGCVVMQNGDLVKVSKYIFLNQTPICIYDKIKYDTVENIREKRDRLIGYLRDWKTNWETKNIDGYIKYYDKNFHYNKMDLPAFKTYKDKLNQAYRFIKVSLSDINIYAYGDYFMVMFHQLYISDKNHFYSKKIQYWKDLDDTAKMADERTVSLPAISRFEASKGNYISIDEFRKDYLKQLESGTIRVVPHEINLTRITIVDRSVKLFLKKSGPRGEVKVVPVLRLENGDSSMYQSLEGVTLDSGVPQDFSNAVFLGNKEKTVVMKKGEEYKLRSLTLFLVNDKNNFEQIITYFVNK
jgi:murein L,D-transpeptidase YafK